jgi:hypothetical protein
MDVRRNFNKDNLRAQIDDISGTYRDLNYFLILVNDKDC